MRRVPRVAVVGQAAVLRHGVALQLRLRGFGVPDEPATLGDVGAGVELVVVVPPVTLDAAQLHAVRARRVHVVVLCGTCPEHPQPGLCPAVPQQGAGLPGRLSTLTLDAGLDAGTLAAHLRQLLHHGSAARPPAPMLVEQPWRRLTETEDAVLGLLAQGYSNTGIAVVLCLSTKTVEGAVTALFDKLGLDRDDPARNRRVTAALAWAGAD